MIFRGIEKFNAFMQKQQNNGSMSFQDIKINCENIKFITSVYQKTTFSGVLPILKVLFPNLVNVVQCSSMKKFPQKQQLPKEFHQLKHQKNFR